MKVVKSCNEISGKEDSILFGEIPMGIAFRYAGSSYIYIKMQDVSKGIPVLVCLHDNRVYQQGANISMTEYEPFPEAVFVTNEK